LIAQPTEHVLPELHRTSDLFVKPTGPILSNDDCKRHTEQNSYLL